MLDDQDTADADQQELQAFLSLQQGEAVVAAKRKRERSPLPVAGPSSKKIRSDGPRKCSRHRTPVEDAAPESPRRVRLVVPPGRSVAAPTYTPVPSHASPSLMEVPGGHPSVQGSSGLVRLAAVAEAQSGLVQQPISCPATRTPIKGIGPDLLSSNMPPAPRPPLVPRALATPPYRAENQRLAARVRLLESQLADSQRENSSLTSALRDTSHALESRQREVEQLRSSSHEVLEHKVEYRRVLDQFLALDEALPGAPGQSLLEHFRKLQKDLRDATRERKAAVEKLSSSTRKNSQLTTTLLYQQGLVDESNALATRQRRLVEELQEDLHRTRDRAAFVEQMLEGDLNKTREDLRRVATFAHRLHHSDPTTVLHHHHRYIGAIIEAVVAFLRRGLDSEDLDVVVHNFWLALDYMQTARGVHGDLYMRSISSIQWFFSNAVDEDEGLYRMVLEHSRFNNNSPFLTAAQHAGFAPPSDNSLEPPLHRRMFALSMALPHSDGAGMWADIVPALPSLDQLTTDWERLMLQYIHHITDTPLPGTDTQVPMSSVEPVAGLLAEVVVERSVEVSAVPESASSVGPDPQVPLFLPEQESPTSPSPPPPSPTPPPLFGSVADLAIDLTGDDDDLYEMEESRLGRVSVAREVVDLAACRDIVKEEPL
ncbi:hypothetical protein EV368DRAFT_85719 [Lentinula lateritia]|nr:hypothetical protein EV368DRAFT_85719 [Lentinula lateritia]